MATGFPVKANYATGDVLTAANMNDLSGTVNYLQYSANGTLAAKNCLINGGFDIWQRGTSGFTTNGSYTADRWYLTYSTSTITVSQESTIVPAGEKYSYKIAATGANGNAYVNQVIETLNAIQYAGQNVTFSVSAAASASSLITLGVQYSTGVDTAVGGSFTSITPTSGGSGTVSTTASFTNISGVYAIPATAQTIKVYIQVATTAGQQAYLGKAQLELGSTQTTFSRAGGTIQGELAACQRYYVRYSAESTYSRLSTYGTATATTTVQAIYPFSSKMRVAPTSVDYSALQASDGVNSFSISSVALAAASNASNGVVNATTTGLTQYRPYLIAADNNTAAYIGFSAEL